MKHIGTQTIETNRLILRRYAITDADDMFQNWLTDPEVNRFWGWDCHKNIDETKSYLLQWIDDYSNIDIYHWVIVLKETAQSIGYIYLNEINVEEKSASIHFLISRKYWGRGIMTEVFKSILAFSFIEIGIIKIHTHHHINNQASGKVMQKSGMRYIETRYRKVHDCEQISGDYCYYETTKDEWQLQV